MWLYIYVPLCACLNTVTCRDAGKTFSMKTLPHVTNSLVNLGKIDISFHLNVQPEDVVPRSEFRNQGSTLYHSPKLETVTEEPCPCSSLTYLKDSSQVHPSELLNKILSGNDLFSAREPNSSPLCCDSHEHVQEDVLLEFGPKQTQMVVKPQSFNSNPFPFLPFLLNTLKQRPSLPTVSAKPRAVEIFFFPKKRGMLPSNFDRLNTLKKNDTIRIVGDNEIRNDFKAMKFVPPLPSSVKKDLALQEKTKSVANKKVMEKATNEHPNIVA